MAKKKSAKGGAVTLVIESKGPRRASNAGDMRSAGVGKTARGVSPLAPPRQQSQKEILAYNAAQAPGDKRICDALATAIDRHLPGAERKIWHRHPVWFLDGNPIVGYSKLKDCIRLLFWSGQSFDERGLAPEGSFKAAEARFTDQSQIPAKDLHRWLKKSVAIQWDYKNIVKRRGKLERLR